MRVVFFIIISCFVSLNLWGQRFFWEEGMLIADSVEKSNYVNFSGGQFINSKTIDNQFVDAIFSGANITKEILDNTSSRLVKANYIGSNTRFNVAYYQTLDKLNWGIKLNTRDFVNANITDDAFGLVFRGNRYKQGEELELTNLNGNLYSYNQYGLNIEIPINDFVTVGSHLSYLSCYAVVNTELSEGSLYTSSLGDSIKGNFTGELKYYLSDKHRLSPLNNSGIALDAYFYGHYNNLKYYLSFSDIGIISDKNFSYYKIDTTFTYTGIELSSDLELDSVIGNNFIISDTLIQLPGVDKISSNAPVILPFQIKAAVQYKVTDNLRLQASLDYIVNANYSPRIGVVSNYQFNFPLQLELLANYGGYSKLDVGLGMNYTFSKLFTAYFKTFYLEDLISPSKTSGQGNYFGIIVSW